MKKLILLLLALVCLSAFVNAQGTVSHVRYGASLPASCSATDGEVFFLTSGTVGLYSCTATNTWTLSGSSSSAYGGANVYTSSHTIGSTDMGKLVVMNCSASCTVTFEASPTSGDYFGVMSIGSSLATVSLNSHNYNGSASVPVLNSYRDMRVASDGSNFFGDAPLSAGTNITLTPASNALGIAAATGSGSGTVNSGTSGQYAYYASTGAAVSGSAAALQVNVGGNVAAIEHIDGSGVIRKIEIYPNSGISDNCSATTTGSAAWAIVTLGGQSGQPGGLVEVHPGVYACSQSLTIDYDWITVAGTVKPHWNCCGLAWPTHATAGTPGGAHFVWTTGNGVVIGTTTANMHGDSRHHSPVIKRLYLDGSYSAGIGFYDAGNTDEEEVSDNTFIGWSTGAISTAADSHWIENNNIQTNGGYGITDTGYAGIITKNIIWDNGGTGIIATSSTNSTPMQITDNRIGDVPLAMSLNGTVGGVVADNAFKTGGVGSGITNNSVAGVWQIHGNSGTFWDDQAYNSSAPTNGTMLIQNSAPGSSIASGQYVPIAQFFTPNMATGSFSEIDVGRSFTTNNECAFGFGYVGAASTSNFARIGCFGQSDTAQFLASGLSIFQKISLSGAPTGSYVKADGNGYGNGGNGAVAYTSSHTIGSSDLGKLVIMNCSTACTLTFEAAPTSNDNWAVLSIGSSTATISLNGLTYNGSASVPVLNKYRDMRVWSDGSNYFGDAPLAAGTNVSLTPGTNAMTVAATSGGGGSGSLVLVEAHTASSSSSLDFTTCLTSTYDEYQIEMLNVVPATSGTTLYVRMSTDGGSTFDSATNYSSVGNYYFVANSGATSTSSLTATGIILGDTLNTSTNYGVSGSYKLYQPLSTSVYKMWLGQSQEFNSSNSSIIGLGVAGTYRSTTAVNAFRLVMASGNIASGTVRCYGIAH